MHEMYIFISSHLASFFSSSSSCPSSSSSSPCSSSSSLSSPFSYYCVPLLLPFYSFSPNLILHFSNDLSSFSTDIVHHKVGILQPIKPKDKDTTGGEIVIRIVVETGPVLTWVKMVMKKDADAADDDEDDDDADDVDGRKRWKKGRLNRNDGDRKGVEQHEE